MTTPPRKLERIASDLDDLSIAIDEIKDEIDEGSKPAGNKLDRAKADIESASDLIEESRPEPPQR